MSHWISKLYGQALVSNVDTYEIVSKQTCCNVLTININWGIRDFSFTLHFHISEPTKNTDILKPTCFCNLIYMFTKLIIVLRCNSIHLLPGYEGNNTFIVPMVPTIFRGKLLVQRGLLRCYYPNIKYISVLLNWTTVQFKFLNYVLFWWISCLL
jgi:hypothetical protein